MEYFIIRNAKGSRWQDGGLDSAGSRSNEVRTAEKLKEGKQNYIKQKGRAEETREGMGREQM